MGDKSPTKTIKEIMLADGDGFPPQEIQLQQLNPEDRDDTYSTKGDLAREVTEDDVAADIIVKAGAWDGVPVEFILSRDAQTHHEKVKTKGKKYLKNFRLRTGTGEQIDTKA